MTAVDDLSPHHSAAAYVLALSTLPGMGPARLRALLDLLGAEAAWHRIGAGSLDAARVAVHRGLSPSLLAAWGSAQRSTDVAALWSTHAAAGVRVLLPGTPGYPTVLCGDESAPAMLCALGDVGAFEGRRVAVVGTRRATRYGHDIARRLGAELAEAGVSVVSGLALGIDGAAHEGALEVAGGASPIGVVGGGLDVIYPPRHRSLWARVSQRGAMCSEAALGTRPEPWRFPARNRIIAALAEAVVVVESPERGGSMLTVDEALLRDRPVLAVPGPITSASSAGSNRLISDGAAPLLSTDDVLLALGLTGSDSAATLSRGSTQLAGPAAAVLDALGWQPSSLDEIAAAVGMPIAELARHLSELEATGWVSRTGTWFERRSR